MAEKSEVSDIYKRAQLFSLIERLIKTHEEDADATVMHAGGLKPDALDLGFPCVTVLGSSVFCGDKKLDLSRRPLMLKLFRIFAESPGHEVERDELLRQLYAIDDVASRSEQYIASHFNNAVKMISRARIKAVQALGEGRGGGLEWFVYDVERKSWHFYRWYHDRIN